jgi:hypothetical protein
VKRNINETPLKQEYKSPMYQGAHHMYRTALFSRGTQNKSFKKDTSPTFAKHIKGILSIKIPQFCPSAL